MIMLKDINERKAVLRQIIPQLHINRVAGPKSRIGGLNWAEFFASNPDKAALLGYGTNQKVWNANNVVGKWLMKHEGITPGSGSNGYTPQVKASPASGLILTDPNERRQLMMEIYPQLEETTNGQKSWKRWFETHAEHAAALGYDQLHTRPKLWAANLRMTQQDRFQREALTPQTPVVAPNKLSEDIKVLEQKADIIAEMQRKAEVKELKDRLREMETLNANCRAELDGAKDIIYELMMELRQLKK